MTEKYLLFDLCLVLPTTGNSTWKKSKKKPYPPRPEIKCEGADQKGKRRKQKKKKKDQSGEGGTTEKFINKEEQQNGGKERW